MERYSVRGAIQPGLKIIARYFKTGLGFQPGQTGWKIHVIAVIFFIRAGKATRVCASTVFSYLSKLAFSTPVLAQKGSGKLVTSSWKFAFCDRAEIEHAMATIFQPGGRSEISARAETHDWGRNQLTYRKVWTKKNSRNFFFPISILSR